MQTNEWSSFLVSGPTRVHFQCWLDITGDPIELKLPSQSSGRGWPLVPLTDSLTYRVGNRPVYPEHAKQYLISCIDSEPFICSMAGGSSS